MYLNSSRFVSPKRKFPVRKDRPALVSRALPSSAVPSRAVPSRAVRSRAKEQRSLNRNQLIDQLKLETIVACFSYINCGDGPSSEKKRAHFIDFLSEIKFKIPDDYVFLFPSTSKVTVGRRIRSSYLTCFSKVSLRLKLLASLFSLVSEQRELSPETEIKLKEIADFFRIKPEKYLSLKERIAFSDGVKRKSSSRKKNNIESLASTEMKMCYEALSCYPHDSDSVLKQKYRSLVKELHPDCNVVNNLSEEQISSNLKNFHKIQKAYEAIKPYRRL